MSWQQITVPDDPGDNFGPMGRLSEKSGQWAVLRHKIIFDQLLYLYLAHESSSVCRPLEGTADIEFKSAVAFALLLVEFEPVCQTDGAHG
jgi:hypothetical protein